LFAPLLLATTLIIDRAHVAARFDPRAALGATIDVHDEGETAKIFTPPNVEAMLSAGFQPLSYRLATELCGEAWHWNPRGTWSDAVRQQGYWTSSDESTEPIDISYGYRLPRRGNTIDQSRNSDWSRIDDGDRSTFWKSNPYLGDRPQWVVVDLGARRRVDWIRIAWGEPHAVEYSIQYWTGVDAINDPNKGEWITVGEVQCGTDTLVCAAQAGVPVPHMVARYVRIYMTRSSHTGGGDDPRDRVGFAVAEISVGRGDVDYVRHAPSHDQTVIWVSSTDPWHRASDIDRTLEQPGFDTIFRSGLTRGLPMLTPVAMLYGVPEDAAAEIRFLRRRGYAFSQIEMGEEPDGQNIAPEDYAELYMRWADAVHAADPSLRLGGPAFQSTRDFTAFWPDERGRTSWIGRFVDALRARGRLADFAFFSFEWYPFDDVCGSPQQQLLEAPRILERVLQRWRTEGAPTDIPWLATEYGWSSYAAEAEVDLPAALFNAEFVAQFLSEGGGAAYFYGYEPQPLNRERRCPSWGNLTLFLGDRDRKIRAKLATYFAAQLVMHEWLQPGGMHDLHSVRGTTDFVRAFAVQRPNGTWAMLIINKDSRQAHRVSIAGELHVVQYSRAQYEWHAAGENGRPIRDEPPRRYEARDEVTLPPWSITVVALATSRRVRGLPARAGKLPAHRPAGSRRSYSVRRIESAVPLSTEEVKTVTAPSPLITWKSASNPRKSPTVSRFAPRMSFTMTLTCMY